MSIVMALTESAREDVDAVREVVPVTDAATSYTVEANSVHLVHVRQGTVLMWYLNSLITVRAQPAREVVNFALW